MPRSSKKKPLPLIPLPEFDEVRFTGNLFNGVRGNDDGVERPPLDALDLFKEVMRYHDAKDAAKAAKGEANPLDIEGAFGDPWTEEVTFTGTMFHPEIKGDLPDQPPLKISDFTYEERLQKRNRTLDT